VPFPKVDKRLEAEQDAVSLMKPIAGRDLVSLGNRLTSRFVSACLAQPPFPGEIKMNPTVRIGLCVAILGAIVLVPHPAMSDPTPIPCPQLLTTSKT